MNVKVNLQPIVSNINLPTVLKTAILPGDLYERLFIATQVGEIYHIGNESIETFLDIRPLVLELGTSNGGYDERGLLGLAFHPEFYYNGLFYLHYSVAGTQGPGAPLDSFEPNPCDPATLNLKWENREVEYDHIDTVEEWSLQSNNQPIKQRTLLNLRRPFSNHNGVNSLNFSPETGNLVLTTGDGGSGYDPFNLSQDNMEIAGKIIEIDVNANTFNDNIPIVTRFGELPLSIQETLTVIAKGVRNIPGISYQKFYDGYIKYVGNVGQNLVESIFSFIQYQPIPVPQFIGSNLMNTNSNEKDFINLGWRGWEGDFPTLVIRTCLENPSFNEKTVAFYDDALITSTQRIHPLTCYYHMDPRPNKFEGTALTGVSPYMGSIISNLTGSIVFTDFVRKENSNNDPARGVLGYTRIKTDCKLNNYGIIETDYNFGSKSAFFVSLGANLDQSRLFLGVNGSPNVTDLNQGAVFEIIP